MAYVFIARADQNKYGGLLKLHTTWSGNKTDECPKNLQDAYGFLS